MWGLKVTVFQGFMITVKVLTWNIRITELVWNMGLQTWSFPQIVFSDDVATKFITLKFFSHTNSWQAIQTHHFWSHYWVSFPISYSVHPNYCLETMNKLYSITLWVWYIQTQWHHHWNIQYNLYILNISMMMSLGVDTSNTQGNTVYFIHCFKVYWE